jgi:hypothetical protein
MENYPSNSNNKVQTEGAPAATKDKPEKQIKQITVGKVSRRKAPLGKRFMETFGGGDAQGVAVYIVQDVLLPAAKDMVIDAVQQGIERMVLGESRARGRSNFRPGGSSGYTSYNRIGGGNPNNRRDRDRDREEPRRDISQRGRATHNFDEIVLDSRAEAEATIDQLIMIIDEYEIVTVADLYGMIGITEDYPDAKWGWTSLAGARAVRLKNGYLLDLPKPEYIN